MALSKKALQRKREKKKKNGKQKCRVALHCPLLSAKEPSVSPLNLTVFVQLSAILRHNIT